MNVTIKEINDIGTVKILMLKGEKGDVGEPTQEQVTTAVTEWLDAHPEATTTVEDGSITAQKLNKNFLDSLYVSEEASGAVASFDDGADDVPVSSLKVALEPVQLGSGDPSPSNIRPIYPANGKNLLNTYVQSDTVNNVAFTVNSDGTVTVNGTANGNADFYFVGASATYASANIPTGSYKFSGCPLNGTGAMFIVENGGPTYSVTNNSETTVSIDSTKTYRIFIRINNGKTVTNEKLSPMLCLAPITDASYQPYQGIMVERCGKNLLDPNEMIVYSDGKGRRWYYTNGMTLKANQTYTLSVSGSSQNITLYFISKASNTPVATSTNSVSYTPTEDTLCYFQAYRGEVIQDANVFQLEYGAEASSYEEFVALTSYPYTLGGEVYGGTVDLATGVLTVNRAVVDMGSLVWQDGVYSNFTSPSIASTVLQISSSVLPKLMAENLKTIIYDNRNASTDARIALSPAGILDVRGTSYENAAAFKTAVNGVKLVYELATPTTVQLTPTEVKTLLGYNNISSSGTVDVIYHADTKLYIDNLSKGDTDMTADRNIASGAYFTINNKLYLATTAIAQGETVAVGVNCTETDIASALNALNA